MTDDFKETLLEYLTGNLDIQSGLDEPQFNIASNFKNDFITYCLNNVGTGFEVIGYLQDSSTNYYLAYGNYGVSDYYGAIVILDENMTPIQAIKEFDSGTQFRKFVMLNVDEDNYIYGVDNSTSGSNSYRFIMLNKVLTNGLATGTFKATLRQSYYFPSAYNVMTYDYSTGDELYKLRKEIGTATYYMTGVSTTSSYTGTNVIKFIINVGTANEWKIFNYNKSTTQQIGTYLTGSGENAVFKVYISKLATIGGSSGNYNLAELQVNTTDETLDLQNEIVATENYAVNSKAIVDVNNIYVTRRASIGGIKYIKISKANKTTLAFDDIYTKQITSSYRYSGYLKVVNNQVFAKIIEPTSIAYYDVYLGIVYNNNFYNTKLVNVSYISAIDESVFAMKYAYNLYQFYLQDAVYVRIAQTVFNSNNYNGLSYTNINALVPNSGILYNNNKIIFARNLYNKVVNGNTTESTLQLPNNYCNNIAINKQNLLSETNLIMNSDTEIYETNIYETVNFNFFNTLQMINKNDTSNPVLNPTGASRINDSVSQTKDYSSAKAMKIKVNYTDDTSTITTLSNSQIVITNNIATYTFSVYVNKAITNIQIISMDENTVYQTITGTFTVGNTYTISQDVTIDYSS